MPQGSGAKPPSSYVFALSDAEAETLKAVLSSGNYVPMSVQFASCAAKAPQFPASVALYRSGKCVVQGKGAGDFVNFVLEPLVLAPAGRLASNAATAAKAAAAPDSNPAPRALSEESLAPHAGVDESGKGDFFGPLVVCAAYADSEIAPRLLDVGARDSKSVTSDAEALRIAERIRAVLRPSRYVLAVFPPATYNRLYAKMRSINRLLAWAHARCVEKLHEAEPGMAFAVSDQFGTEDAVRRAMRAGSAPLEIRSRVRAESDIAVAAASILAREAFLRGLSDLSERFGAALPKGATSVRAAGEALVRRCGPAALAETCKCHFRTTDQVLAATGHVREELPPECRVAPKPQSFFRR